MEEFKAEVERPRERTVCEEFQDGEDESSGGFAAEPEREEEEEQDIQKDLKYLCPATTSPFAFETQKKSMFSPPSMTKHWLSSFSFSSPASVNNLSGGYYTTRSNRQGAEVAIKPEHARPRRAGV